jgi:hypothetical protein
LLGASTVIFAALYLTTLWVESRPVPERSTVRRTPAKAGAWAPFESGEELGRWRPFRDPRAAVVEGAQAERIRELEAIGYLGGNIPAAGDSGITYHDAEKAYAGVNFYASGHGAEAILMDMEGRELHRWRCDFETMAASIPGLDPASLAIGREDEDKDFWRRAVLMPNGDVFAIFEGSALLKLDRDSNLIWAVANRSHHDLQVMEDGSIYVLTRKGQIEPRINADEPVLLDYVTHLNAEGEELAVYPIWEALAFSRHSHHLLGASRKGDIFHTNTLKVLDGRFSERSPHFKKGNFLISILGLSTIAILDPALGEIVWTMRGMWWHQHEPQFLDNGNMLIFDNRGGISGGTEYSRVLEFDPLTQEVVWAYEGSAEMPFYTRFCGANQRLPNGNTLITETDNGRVFEVTHDQEIVWEFINPNRAGPEGDLIASVFELIRYEAEYPGFLSGSE